MANMQDILNKPMSAIEAPKPIPAGTYLGVIDGNPEFIKSAKKQTDGCVFSVKLVQPQGDVDQASLQTSLQKADGTMKSLTDVKVKVTQWLTEDSLWRVKQFLEEHLGISPGLSLGEAIPQAMGKQVLVTIKHRPSDDGQNLYMEVAGTAKA